jgi:Spy/CpxP family protein refolding chaperone
MKKLKFVNTVFFMTLLVLSVTSIKAQENAPNAADKLDQKGTNNRRPNLLAELALSPEQIRQIRIINAENKLSQRAAQQRLRAANENLDRAIYADNLDDAGIQLLVKEVQTAQVEVIKLRAATEIAVRRILMPEQLLKFREMRRQFVEKMENRPNKMRDRPLKISNRRFNNRQQTGTSPN